MEKATMHPIPRSERVHGRILQKKKSAKKGSLKKSADGALEHSKAALADAGKP